MANGLPPTCQCHGVVLVLALAVAHAAAAVVATAAAPAAAPELARGLVAGDYMLPAPPAAAGAAVPTGAAAGCVQSVVNASVPCARDILQTLIFKTVHLSADCCRVLAGVGEECVAAVFSGAGDVGPKLLPVVNRVCGLVASIS